MLRAVGRALYCTCTRISNGIRYISLPFSHPFSLGLSSFTIILLWDFQVLYVLVKG